jgi:hypothetical protein
MELLGDGWRLYIYSCLMFDVRSEEWITDKFFMIYLVFLFLTKLSEIPYLPLTKKWIKELAKGWNGCGIGWFFTGKRRRR